MRILQITSGGHQSNGALQYAVQLSNRLVDRGHEVWMLTVPGGYVAQAIDQSDVTLIPSSLHRWPLDELKRIHQQMQELGIQVVHGHSSRACNFAVCLRRLYGVPAVSTAHANKVQVHWAWADRIIAVSKVTETFHRRWNLVRKSRISIIHNPIDTDRFQPLDPALRSAQRAALHVADETPVLLIAGHIVRRKGQRIAVAAMPQILAKFPAAQLWLVGHEDHRYGKLVREDIKRLGIQNSVRLIPPCEDVQRYFAMADLCLCPSLDEPFGLTACESLACEVPVIASSVGGFLETIQHDRSGVLLKRNDAPTLAAATIQMLQNRERCQAFGKVGRRWVQQNLTADAHDQQVEQVYQSLLK